MISPDDYRYLSDLLRTNSGLNLGPGKDYLLESRLLPLCGELGIAGIPDLVRALKRGSDRALIKRICDAMTTGETLFFRDNTPFQVFRERLLRHRLLGAFLTGIGGAGVALAQL